MAAELVQFADFELDRGAYKLRRKGRVMRLQRIPMDLLLLLVERQGQLVTREEIRERIWGKEIFLDSESSINTAVRKLRRVLRDHPDSPRFIATIPAKGYRFIATAYEPTSGAVPIRRAEIAIPTQASKLAEARDGPSGERRRLTVLFCDLISSASIAAQRDPEESWELVTDYYRATVQAIEQYGGHVGPHRSAGLIAYFGWPEAHDNNAESAVRAGLAILEAIAKLDLPTIGRQVLSPRIGIDSGAMVIGTGAGRDADMFGEALDIAAHVQETAAPGTILITANTHRLVSLLFVIEDCGAQPLKGFDRPVKLYRVIQPSGARGRLEAAAARGLTPFVGRDKELGLLMSRWEQVIGGEGQVALIAGEPGIGKSRLVRRFHESLADTPHRWIEVAAGAFFQSAPFYAVERMLHELLAPRSGESAEDQLLVRLESALAQAGPKLAEAVPLIAPLLNLTIPAKYPPSPHSPEQKRRRLLAALVAWLMGAAREQPLVIVIEDLHWADPSTLELIELLVEQGSAARLLLLYTARPEFRAQWPLRAHHMHITLNQLSARDSRTIVGEVAAHTALSDETVATVAERTGGVPLFLEELTRSVLEGGDARLAGAGSIPATLQDSLMARLDRLGPAREVIQLGAVIGSEFSYALLHAVHPAAEEALQRALLKLTGAEILYVRGFAPEATYQFKHALIRDAAYDTLLRTRRKELHLQVARTIEEQFSILKETHPEVLARHWTEAGAIEPAIAAWSKAAKIAVSRNAFNEAHESYQQALALLNLLPASAERDSREMETTLSVYLLLNITKGYAAPETIKAIESATALAEKIGDLTQLFNLLTSRGSTHLISGDLSGASAIFDRALELVVRQSVPVNLAYLHVLQTIVRFSRADFEGAEKQFSAWFELFSEPGALQSISVAVNAFAFGSFTAWMRGQADAARRRQRQMIAIADQGGPFDIANAEYCAAHLETYLKDCARAEAFSVAAVELGEKHHFPNPVARGRGTLGLARARLHRTAEGIALIKQSLAELREIGTRMGITTVLAALAEAQGLDGCAGAALESVELALRVLPDEVSHRPETIRLRGELQLSLGELELGEASYREAVELAQTLGAKAWELRATTSLARLLRDTGRRDEARTMLADIYGWFTEGFDTADLKDAKVLLTELGD